MAILSGCGDSAPSILAVKAVAAGVPSLAPFFDEGEQLGRDEPDLRSLEPHSGLQQGNTPGLYGGTQKPKVCDVRKLEDFLTAPENKNKAQEWARIVGINVDGIGDYLDELTPVLLRHDTLVKNHDYKKGKAVPFDALLEAGIAVLVDEQGLPAVKCSCGNPLRAFDDDPDDIKVEFAGDNVRWDGYDESAMVVVKPAPGQLKEIKLVDVEDPDQGISREVGTTGESDKTFDTRARQAVPSVRGMTFGEAGAAMADKGLAVTVAGDGMPPGDAPVTGSSPGPGAQLEFGAAVALHVDWPGASSEESTDDPGADSEPGSGSGSGSDSGSPGTGPSSTGPSDTDGSSSGGSPSGSESTPTDQNTTPSGGGSEPTDGGSSPTDETTPPPTGGTSLTPSPSRTSEKPSSDPTPTPTSTPTVPSTPPSPTRSSTPPPTPDPDPTPPADSGPPTDTPTSSAPEPPSDPPSDNPGGPGDPSDSGDPGDPGDPVEEPAQSVWI
ncbi:PASTA domain-containing protein [Streptomyces sp. DSM 40750]|uniref:PASTA domain-containing protein n=1 Tax=Streptomyces sp. DSM 40750 TaxID=2801030 RepID=UPI00214A9EE6|nr:PASTA domain-containing protein [Streptomyces sp. DSM 40750]UUU20401.1 PASTA domain-containing protein [Streptomyces sp. DSM 40750]